MIERKKAVVVGAGLRGICAGIQLARAGIEDFVILERAAHPGGTWRDNTYPGCACDVPVSLYQFSFAPSLHWRHVFPRAAEMQQYLGQLVSGFGLTDRLRGGSGVRSAAWDETARTTWADPRCNSWYKTAAGHITQNWSSHTRDYAAATKTVNFDDYVLRPRAQGAAQC